MSQYGHGYGITTPPPATSPTTEPTYDQLKAVIVALQAEVARLQADYTGLLAKHNAVVGAVNILVSVIRPS